MESESLIFTGLEIPRDYIRIRRTKLCVLILIAAPSYLTQFAISLTSVANTSCPGFDRGIFLFSNYCICIIINLCLNVRQ